MNRARLSLLKLWIAAAILGTICGFAVYCTQAHMSGKTAISDGGPLPLCDPKHPEGRFCRGKAVDIADGSDPMPLCRRNCGPKQCPTGQSCAEREDRSDLSASMNLVMADYKPTAHLVFTQGVPRGCRYVYTCHHYTPDGTAYCAWELWCGA